MESSRGSSAHQPDALPLGQTPYLWAKRLTAGPKRLTEVLLLTSLTPYRRAERLTAGLNVLPPG